LFRLAAIAVFLFICFATLSPIELRPQTGEPGPERFFAFAVLGALLALSFPNLLGRVLAATIAIAFGLEVLQLLMPTRHGHLSEALLKCSGSAAGVGLTAFFQLLGNSQRGTLKNDQAQERSPPNL
jgi:peptidoglycan/LPS O-acetylase OafA/YrhL